MIRRWALVFATTVLAGCGSQRRDAASTAPATPDAMAPAPAPVPPPSAPSAMVAPAPPSPLLADPLWQRAAEGDPLERARLAAAVGAAGLMDALDAGEPVTTIALGALPYADDADEALGRLGDLARSRPEREAVLAAILAIAGRPRRQREMTDPEGVRRCADVVIELAGRRDLPQAERAMAISAARAFAERGFRARAVQ